MRVKVADFGLAKPIGGEGVVAGTWYSSAPECFLAGYGKEVEQLVTIGPKADSFSAGIVLAEFVLRAFPYGDRISGRIDPNLITRRIIHEGLRPKLPDNVPPPLVSLMSDCWNADIEQRPTFSEIITTIKAFPTRRWDELYPPRPVPMDHVAFRVQE